MTKTNLLVDIGVFVGFLLTSSPNFTGNLIHEWLGVALAVTLIVHILLHWNWIAAVGFRFFKNLWQVSRLQFVLNILIFVAFITVIASGLIISRNVMSALGIQVAAGRSWRLIHSTASNAAVILIGFHMALNWNWIARMIKKYLFQPILPVFRPGLKTQPVVIETTQSK
jgi:hypothetical protein